MAPVALAYGGEKKVEKSLDRSILMSDLRESNMNVWCDKLTSPNC